MAHRPVEHWDTSGHERYGRDPFPTTELAGQAVRGLVACSPITGAKACASCPGVAPDRSGAAFRAQAALIAVGAGDRAAADLAGSRVEQPAIPVRRRLIVGVRSRHRRGSICEACAPPAAGKQQQRHEDSPDGERSRTPAHGEPECNRESVRSLGGFIGIGAVVRRPELPQGGTQISASAGQGPVGAQPHTISTTLSCGLDMMVSQGAPAKTTTNVVGSQE
jgi:hypothetical protein